MPTKRNSKVLINFLRRITFFTTSFDLPMKKDFLVDNYVGLVIVHFVNFQFIFPSYHYKISLFYVIKSKCLLSLPNINMSVNVFLLKHNGTTFDTSYSNDVIPHPGFKLHARRNELENINYSVHIQIYLDVQYTETGGSDNNQSELDFITGS